MMVEKERLILGEYFKLNYEYCPNYKPDGREWYAITKPSDKSGTWIQWGMDFLFFIEIDSTQSPKFLQVVLSC